MVKIINGEIVSDDDPRVTGAQQRRSAPAGGRGGRSGGQGNAGYGHVASLLDPPATSQASEGRSARSGDSQAQGPGPLDSLAQSIGVHGQFVKIPGAMGVPEKEVPKIYLVVAGLVAMIGISMWGWRAAALMVFAYVLINQQGSRQPERRA